MPNTNNTLRRVEAGAIITLNDGTTTWTLTALEPGTYRNKRGWYKRLPWTDRGVRQPDYEGDEQQGTLALDCKYSGLANANDLGCALKARNTTGASAGQMKAWSIVIKNPDAKGAIVGEQITHSPCYVESFEVNAGVEFDHVKVEFAVNVPIETVATY